MAGYLVDEIVNAQPAVSFQAALEALRGPGDPLR
jgi:hypothetical protein